MAGPCLAPHATLAAAVLAERRLGLPGTSAGLEPATASAGWGVEPSRCRSWVSWLAAPGRWLTRVP